MSNFTNCGEWGRGMWFENCREKKINVVEMKCLRSLVRVSRIDGVRDEEVRRRAGIERELASRVGRRVLRWF